MTTLNEAITHEKALRRKSDLSNVANTIIMIDESIDRLNAERAELVSIGEAEVIDIHRVMKIRNSSKGY